MKNKLKNQNKVGFKKNCKLLSKIMRMNNRMKQKMKIFKKKMFKIKRKQKFSTNKMNKFKMKNQKIFPKTKLIQI